jgi:holo-ACP synthase/triphosphoribosyl-dephospho-CoA synthase
VQLRQEGLNAEKEMFRATGGVNTHKGAIFLMGTVCGAIGRLWDPEQGKTEETDSCHKAEDERDNSKECIDPVRIAAECSKMTKHIMKLELERLTERSSQIDDLKTAGEKIWVRYGLKGARGELSDGLPGVVKTALPVFRMLLSDGADRNAAGAGAFVALIARGSDTNMIKRGGASEAEKAAQQARVIVREKKLLDTGSIEQLDKKFIARNLSPGGCADLLAITYFLNDYCIQNKTENT